MSAALLETTVQRVMTEAQLLLKPKRKKADISGRKRPIIIYSDTTIEKYLRKKLILQNGECLFQGEYRYDIQLWKTITDSDIGRIARFIIDKNTVR